MTTLDPTTSRPLEPGHVDDEEQQPEGLDARRIAAAGALIFSGIVIVLMAILFPKIRSTLVTVIVAVVVTGGIWVAFNLLANEIRDQWQRFLALTYAILGILVGALLHGNRLTVGSDGGFFTWILGPLVAGVVVGALGFLIASTADPRRRLVVSIVSMSVVGAGAGLLIREEYYPGVDPVTTVVYTLVFAAIGAGLSMWRTGTPTGGALLGATLGWLLGYWGGADLGDGSIATSLIGGLVPGALIGARLGLVGDPDYQTRASVEQSWRRWIFLAPALIFVTITLVIPAFRTAYLSLLDRDSEAWVGLQNYVDTFTDKDSLNLDNWANMFGSSLMWAGVVLLVIAAIVGSQMKKRTGRAVELGNPTGAPLIVGLLLVSFAAFTAMRGTIINNLWWVVAVTFFSTAIGLAVAVLADGRFGERIGKSVIFMPMAISLVGASIIWRFMYQPRDVSKEQTGVLNALWVGLGNLSTGSGLPTLIGAAFFLLLLVICLAFLAGTLVRRAYGRAVVPGVLSIVALWVFIRYAGIIGEGIGGFAVAEDGTIEPATVAFVQETPWNNFFLMIVLMWIQVGFAMVILSAAIKAVPTELIEAAKIDGATNSQVFWRVTLPQIGTTIGVVVTTLIVTVMKVYDIVKVMTNGQFGTQVLANDMFQQAFSNVNIGRGAALAMLILLSVLPVMVLNIRRMQKEGG